MDEKTCIQEKLVISLSLKTFSFTQKHEVDPFLLNNNLNVYSSQFAYI